MTYTHFPVTELWNEYVLASWGITNSGDGFLFVQSKAITCIIADLLSIGPLRT